MITNQIKDRAVLFLEASLAKVNPSLANEIALGNIIIRDQKLYVNKAILVGSNNLIEMITKSDSKKVGLTSYEKGKTESDTAMWVTGLIARYAPAAADANTTNKEYSEFVYDYAGVRKVPNEILNAEIEIRVGQLLVYEGALRNLFVNGRECNQNPVIDSYMELKAPKFIKGEQDVQFTLRLADGSSIPGTAGQNHFLQIELDGAATSVKI